MTISEALRCYLGGHESTAQCASCAYSWETDEGFYVCMPRNLMKDALSELEADRVKKENIIFGLKCKGHLEVMDCNECPWSVFAPHCEVYINKAAIQRIE